MGLIIGSGAKKSSGSGGNVRVTPDGILQDKLYLFKASGDDSPVGTFILYTEPDIPTKTSELENDSDFATNAGVSGQIGATNTRIQGNSDSILENKTQIAILKGAFSYIPATDFGIPEPTQQQLIDYAASLGIEVREGLTVINTYNGSEWRFDEVNTNSWQYQGTGIVTQATNERLGIVRGSGVNLRVRVLESGEMEVIGLAEELASKAIASEVVHLAGAQTVAGRKTFSTVPRTQKDPEHNNDLVRMSWVMKQLDNGLIPSNPEHGQVISIPAGSPHPGAGWRLCDGSWVDNYSGPYQLPRFVKDTNPSKTIAVANNAANAGTVLRVAKVTHPNSPLVGKTIYISWNGTSGTGGIVNIYVVEDDRHIQIPQSTSMAYCNESGLFYRTNNQSLVYWTLNPDSPNWQNCKFAGTTTNASFVLFNSLVASTGGVTIFDALGGDKYASFDGINFIRFNSGSTRLFYRAEDGELKFTGWHPYAYGFLEMDGSGHSEFAAIDRRAIIPRGHVLPTGSNYIRNLEVAETRELPRIWNIGANPPSSHYIGTYAHPGEGWAPNEILIDDILYFRTASPTRIMAVDVNEARFVGSAPFSGTVGTGAAVITKGARGVIVYGTIYNNAQGRTRAVRTDTFDTVEFPFSSRALDVTEDEIVTSSVTGQIQTFPLYPYIPLITKFGKDTYMYLPAN